MKKISLLTCLPLLSILFSCNVNEELAPEAPPIRFRGVMESPITSPETRVYAQTDDEKLYRIYWNANDHVSIFTKKTYNREFEFTGETGETAGDFERYGTDPDFFAEVDIEDEHYYSIIPYQKRNACDYDGMLRVPIPSTQYFSEGSSGIGCNLFMVARSSNGGFAYKHAVGYVGLKLYGAGVSVASATFKSNNNEPLAGDMYVVFTEDGIPFMSSHNSGNLTSSVTLVCDPPVVLASTASEYKTIWFALPPQVLTKGFSFTITDVNGGTYSYSRSSAVEIKRAYFSTVKAQEVIIEGGDTPSVINVSSVQLNAAQLALNVGETHTLTATVSPDDATDKTVTWSSSDTSVASVDADGKVTAIAPGGAVITVTTTDGSKTATCIVTVTANTIAVESVSLDKTSLSLEAGDAGTLVATVTPDNATNKAVTWTSTSPDVATVDENGNVTALTVGTAFIIVSTADGGKTALCTVTVTPKNIAVESVSLDKTALSLEEGASEVLIATVNPDNAADKSVTWASSNTAVATVSETGEVIAVSPGEAVITVTTNDGSKTASCNVTVTAKVVAVESVSLDKAELSLEEGASEVLIATVNPDNAADKSVTWASSNTAVATVSETGEVIAVSPGEAVITVTTNDGSKTASCNVTVTAKVVAVESVSLNKTELSLIVGGDETLIATVTPENAVDKTVTWSSSDTSVATVDNDGKVIAKAIGEAVITVTTTDGGKTATCTVTVTKNPNQAGDPIGIGEEEEF